LRAHVDQSDARNARIRIAFGVSDLCKKLVLRKQFFCSVRIYHGQRANPAADFLALDQRPMTAHQPRGRFLIVSSDVAM
jgi:hypothetical protein